MKIRHQRKSKTSRLPDSAGCFVQFCDIKAIDKNFPDKSQNYSNLHTRKTQNSKLFGGRKIENSPEEK